MATPNVIELHAVRHWMPEVRQAGFPLDHAYLERCWTPVVGPSSVLLLRRCYWLWADATPARVPAVELARQLGLGKGTGPSSPIWHTVERVTRFGLAAMPRPGELHVYTEVPPVPTHWLRRLPGWCRVEHDRLLGDHLDALARSAGPVPAVADNSVSADRRMAARLDRLTGQQMTTARSISR